MIRVSRLNGQSLVVNSDLIETVEATPDTVITLTTGRKIVVKDTVDEIVERVINFKSSIHMRVYK
jgi:flagellar protein FlbD